MVFDLDKNKSNEDNVQMFLNKANDKEKALELLFMSSQERNKSNYIWDLAQNEIINLNEFDIYPKTNEFVSFIWKNKERNSRFFTKNPNDHQKSLANFSSGINLENINNKLLDNDFLKIAAIFLWNSQSTSNYLNLEGYEGVIDQNVFLYSGINRYDESILVQNDQSYRYNFDILSKEKISIELIEKIMKYFTSKNKKANNDLNLSATFKMYDMGDDIFIDGKIYENFELFSNNLKYIFEYKLNDSAEIRLFVRSNENHHF